MSTKNHIASRSPAELVAVARAAHVVGDKELERAAKQELLAKFRIEIRFLASAPVTTSTAGGAR